MITIETVGTINSIHIIAFASAACAATAAAAVAFFVEQDWVGTGGQLQRGQVCLSSIESGYERVVHPLIAARQRTEAKIWAAVHVRLVIVELNWFCVFGLQMCEQIIQQKVVLFGRTLCRLRTATQQMRRSSTQMSTRGRWRRRLLIIQQRLHLNGAAARLHLERQHTPCLVVVFVVVTLFFVLILAEIVFHVGLRCPILTVQLSPGNKVGFKLEIVDCVYCVLVGVLIGLVHRQIALVVQVGARSCRTESTLVLILLQQLLVLRILVLTGLHGRFNYFAQFSLVHLKPLLAVIDKIFFKFLLASERAGLVRVVVHVYDHRVQRMFGSELVVAAAHVRVVSIRLEDLVIACG